MNLVERVFSTVRKKTSAKSTDILPVKSELGVILSAQCAQNDLAQILEAANHLSKNFS